MIHDDDNNYKTPRKIILGAEPAQEVGKTVPTINEDTIDDRYTAPTGFDISDNGLEFYYFEVRCYTGSDTKEYAQLIPKIEEDGADLVSQDEEKTGIPSISAAPGHYQLAFRGQYEERTSWIFNGTPTDGEGVGGEEPVNKTIYRFKVDQCFIKKTTNAEEDDDEFDPEDLEKDYYKYIYLGEIEAGDICNNKWHSDFIVRFDDQVVEDDGSGEGSGSGSGSGSGTGSGEGSGEGSGDGEGSGSGDNTGTPKTAIVPCTLSLNGYLKQFALEGRGVWFVDFVQVSPSQLVQVWDVNEYTLDITVPGSLFPIGATSELAIPIGVNMSSETQIQVTCGVASIELLPSVVQFMLVGLRKGFADDSWESCDATFTEMINNERKLNFVPPA